MYPLGTHNRTPAAFPSAKDVVRTVTEKEYDVTVDVVVTTYLRNRLLRFTPLSSFGTVTEEKISGMIGSLCSIVSAVGTNLEF